MIKKTRIYQASTSELYGLVREAPQTERHLFTAQPVCLCKALWLLDNCNYREAYVFMQATAFFSIMSHQSGGDIRFTKDHRALARIVLGMQETLYMGNLSSKRDWGTQKII